MPIFEDLQNPLIQPRDITPALVREFHIAGDLKNQIQEMLMQRTVTRVNIMDSSTSILQSGNNIVFPNQYFAIAAMCYDIAAELIKYCNFFDEHVRNVSQLIEALKAEDYDNQQYVDLFDNDNDKNLFTSFLQGGEFRPGKDIFDASPRPRQSKEILGSCVLKKVKLPDHSSGFLGDLIYNLSKNIDLYSQLRNDLLRQMERRELYRTGVAADFYRNVLRTTLVYDPDFSQVNSFDRSNQRYIKIGNFKVGRNVNLPPNRQTDVDDTIRWSNENIVYCANLEFGHEVFCSDFIPEYNRVYCDKFTIEKENEEYVLYEYAGADRAAVNNAENLHYQQVFYGAPGTGKSHKIDYDLFVNANGEALCLGLKSIDKDFKFRTTFHPDYDYAQFVGAYKPRALQVDLEHEEETDGNSQNIASKTEITYEFVPQIFAKAYVKAWIEFLKVQAAPNAEKVYLVIEEINRGNCAQIFGDIFQLLDRKEGHSDYPIDVDSDFASYIEEQLSNVKQSDGTIANYWNDYKNKIQEWDSSEQGEERADDDFCKIALPPNLNILATMNTSDQSLFPMDSAFKRRFDWEYVPIKCERDATCGTEWNADQFVISVGNSRYMWLDFLKAVNANVYKVTRSEDKQMGEFFIKHSVDYKEFRSKVLFYLWDSVYKDEEGNKDAETVFHFKLEGNQDKTLTFQTLFEGSEVDQKDRIAKIMSKLGVVDQNAPPPQQGEQGANAAAAAPAPAEEPNPAQ